MTPTAAAEVSPNPIASSVWRARWMWESGSNTTELETALDQVTAVAVQCLDTPVAT